MRRAQYETLDDAIHGQTVLVACRWLLVISGIVLALWNPSPLFEMRWQLLVVLGLAAANFYLHAQLLTRRPVLREVAYAASVADVAVVTLLVLIQGGVESNLFVFYFPALLVFAVAFSAGATAAFAGGTLGAYALIALATSTSEADAQAVGVRLLMLAGVAVCGAVYRQIEADRREERSRRPGLLREAAEDVFFGQVVMIWARWFVIVAAGVVTLWSARSAAEMTVNMLLVVLLMALNFFLHARYLVEKPANPTLIRLLGGLDLLVVGAIVLSWHAARGFESSFFVFYYPLLVAFAFVFPVRQVAVFAGTAVATYAAVCLVADPSLVTRIADVKALTIRLITIASVAGLATYYWRFQRDARRSPAGSPSGGTDGWALAEQEDGGNAPAVGGAPVVPSSAGAA